jgi:flavin-dependent dehydrogenase
MGLQAAVRLRSIELVHGYYGDRYALVGDTHGLVGAFKGKGVISTVITGTHAAEAILQQGISELAFFKSLLLLQ